MSEHVNEDQRERARRAMECAYAVTRDLTELQELEDLERQISHCFQIHLRQFKSPEGGRVMVFWSLGRKATYEGELDRPYDPTLHVTMTPEGTVIPSPERYGLGDILLELNKKYDSVPFLAALAQQGVGISRVFSLQPTLTGFQLRAYDPPEVVPGGQPSQRNIDVTSPRQCWKPSADQISVLFQNLPLNDKNKVIIPRRIEIFTKFEDYCDGWSDAYEQLLQILPEKQRREQPISEQDARNACSHFSLLSLLMTIHWPLPQLPDVSYILVPLQSDEALSSMTVFWPDWWSERYESGGLPFLLQGILGYGALRVALHNRALYAAFEEQRRELNKQKQLAYGAYKIGHPLKDRVGPLRRRLRSMLYKFDKYGEKPERANILHADYLLDRVSNLGVFLDLISRAISKNEGMQLFLGKTEWHTESSYQFIDRIKEIQEHSTEVGETPIRLNPHDLTHLSEARIDGWIPRNDGVMVRPVNVIYDELLYEIFRNAVNYSKKTTAGEVLVRSESALVQSANCLVIWNIAKNKFTDQNLDTLRLVRDQWQEWDISDKGPVGGLCILATFLQVTGTGRLLVNVSQGEEGDEVRVGLDLRGLVVQAAISKEDRNGDNNI